MPQIFIQGLLIRDYEEGIIYQRLLEKEILQEAIDFAEQHKLSLTAIVLSVKLEMNTQID